MRGAFQKTIMASKTGQGKSPMPPRAQSVPLLRKSTSLEPLSPTLQTPRKALVVSLRSFVQVVTKYRKIKPGTGVGR